MGDAGELIKIEPLAHRHAAGVDAENLAPPALVGHADHDLAIEAARTAQCLVDGIGTIGRRDDNEVGTLLQPVHQREQLGDKALFSLARHLGTLGGDRIDLVDEDDRRGSAGRLLEHFPQALFRFAIARAHDFRAVDGEELGIAFIGHRLCEAGLAGARRAVEQHTLGRFHAQTDEQLWVAQRQLDHFAQGTDGFLHPPDIVVIDHGAAIARLLELGAQFDFGVLVDMDEALGAGRGDRQADLRQGIGRRAQQLAHIGGHVLHRLLAGCGDEIACHQRAAKEIALQRLGRPLQAHLALGGSEDDAGRRARFAAGDFDMLARAALSIGALQPVESHHVERVILGIGGHGDGGGDALAADLDHVALGDPELLEGRTRHPRDSRSRFFLPRGRDLQAHGADRGGGFGVGHRDVPVLRFENDS